jgi:hypothetical protein
MDIQLKNPLDLSTLRVQYMHSALGDKQNSLVDEEVKNSVENVALLSNLLWSLDNEGPLAKSGSCNKVIFI